MKSLKLSVRTMLLAALAFVATTATARADLGIRVNGSVVASSVENPQGPASPGIGWSGTSGGLNYQFLYTGATNTGGVNGPTWTLSSGGAIANLQIANNGNGFASGTIEFSTNNLRFLNGGGNPLTTVSGPFTSIIQTAMSSQSGSVPTFNFNSYYNPSNTLFAQEFNPTGTQSGALGNPPTMASSLVTVNNVSFNTNGGGLWGLTQRIYVTLAPNTIMSFNGSTSMGVPEPATMASACIALGGLGLAKLRRRKTESVA